nr:transporter substrate-binding domain-containing protein [Roseospira visakhapatnamensis]
MTIAVVDDYPPFAVQLPDGTPAGLLVDLWRAWSETTGRPIVLETCGWFESLAAVREGRVDIHAGLNQTAERAEWMAFSAPIHRTESRLFFRATDPRGVRSVARMGGQRVGVMRDTLHHDHLTRTHPDLQTVPYGDGVPLVQDLVSGALDAVFNEVPAMIGVLDRMGLRGAVLRGPEMLSSNTLHAGIARDRPALVTAVNEGLAALPAGVLADIDRRWLADPRDRYHWPAAADVTLTPDERAWLETTPAIRLAVTDFLDPLDIVGEDGSHAGFNADFIQRLAQALQTDIVPVFYGSWSDLESDLLDGAVHGALGLSRTPERSRHLIMTHPYAYDPVIVVTREDDMDIQAFRDLAERTVSMARGSPGEGEVRGHLGTAGTLVSVDDDGEGLTRLVEGGVDAHVTTRLSYTRHQQRALVRGVRIAARRDLESGALRMAVHASTPQVFSILRKGLHAIPREDLARLRDRWLTAPLDARWLETLSEEERRWIATHRTVRVGLMSDSPPFNTIGVDGDPKGISADILRGVAERVGLGVEMVPGAWSDLYGQLAERRLDVLMDVTPRPWQRDRMHVTAPYLSINHAIIAPRTRPVLEDESGLRGLTVALDAGSGNVAWFRSNEPDVAIREYTDTRAALAAVLRGEADAYVGNRVVAMFVMKQQGLHDLSVHGRLSRSPTDLAMGVRKDWPILAGILDKGLSALGRVEVRTILTRWAGESVDGRPRLAAEPPAGSDVWDRVAPPDVTIPESNADLRLLAGIVVAVILILAALVWLLLRSGRSESLALQMGSRRLRLLVLGALAVLVLLVLTVTWVVYQHNRVRILEVVGSNLQTVLGSTVERLRMWTDARERQVAQLGRDPDLVALTRRLMELPRDRLVVEASPALGDLRRFFRDKGRGFGTTGFAIVALDGTAIGATDDVDLTIEDLLIERRPDAFNRLMAGQAITIPPIRPDPSEADADAEQDTATAASQVADPPAVMFFAAPVIDPYGTVLAIVTRREDPMGDFARILETGRMGRSGETYAFDRTGVMVSRSRFRTVLEDTGRLAPGRTSILNLEVRVPATRRGAWDPGPEAGQLTRMAQSALGGRAGLDLQGYRGYRGALVMGAWTMDGPLGLGIASEIDAAEALGPVTTLRDTMGAILLLTLVLSAGATVVTLMLGERTSRVLLRARDELEERVRDRTLELERTSDRLSLALETMSNGLCVLDGDLRFLMFNDVYQDMMDVPGDLIAPGAPAERLVRFLAERGDYGTGASVEDLVRDRMQSVRSPSDTVRQVQTPKGRVLEVRTRTARTGLTVVALNDITELKEKERDLTLSGERLDMALKGGSLGSWDVDLITGETIVNDRYLEMLGYTRDEVADVRALWLDSMHPDDRPGVLAAGDAYRTGRTQAYEVEYRAHTKDGEERWMISKGAVVKRDETGRPTRMVGTVSDVTERRAAEEALRDSRQLLESVIENSGAVIFAKDIEGRYILVNRQWEALTGLSRDAVIGRHDDEIFPEDLAAELREHDRTTIAARVPQSFEEVARAEMGNRIFLTMKVPLFDSDGAVEGVCGISTEITDRKRMEVELMTAKEKAESATRAKSAFLAAMSHEIRTPMNGVVGMIDLLGETEMDSEQRQMLRIVRDSAFALLQIINDILDFSKIEAGKMGLETMPISVRDVVESVSEILVRNADAKGVRLVAFIDPAIPDRVIGDQVRLRQILFNLMGNAIKFTGSGDGRTGLVQVRADLAEPLHDGMAWVRLQIIDTGIGISEQGLATLFQPFTQAESSTTRRFGGTGLGLTICRSLTDLMRGRITVHSVEGEGSTFTVTLPMPVVDAGEAVQDEPDLTGLRVLLVGTDPNLFASMPAYIAGRGGTVQEQADLFTVAMAFRRGVRAGTPAHVIVFGPEYSPDQVDPVIDVMRAESADVDLPVRFVLVTDDRRVRKGLVTPDLVVVDASPMKRSAFLRGLGVACGRASPDLEDSVERLTAGVRSAPTPEEAAARGCLILVAEDNPTNQDVIRRQLRALGYACEVVDNGRRALEAWASGRFALVLTDCHMPEMDGYEMTGAIRATEARADEIDRIPIIAITANALQGEADRCLAAGMDDYLAKPLEMSKLKRLLARWMPVGHSGPLTAPLASGAASDGETTAPGEPASGVPPSGTVQDDPVTGLLAGGGVDPTYLRETFGDDHDMIRDILKDFVAPARGIRGEIDAAHAAGDPAAVGAAAHKLKSSSRAVGATALADLCQDLETAGKAGDRDRIEARYGDLAGLMDRVTGVIERL